MVFLWACARWFVTSRKRDEKESELCRAFLQLCILLCYRPVLVTVAHPHFLSLFWCRQTAFSVYFGFQYVFKALPLVLFAYLATRSMGVTDTCSHAPILRRNTWGQGGCPTPEYVVMYCRFGCWFKISSSYTCSGDQLSSLCCCFLLSYMFEYFGFNTVVVRDLNPRSLTSMAIGHPNIWWHDQQVQTLRFLMLLLG